MSKKFRHVIRLRLSDETLEAIKELQADFARQSKVASGKPAALSFDEAISRFMLAGVALWKERKRR